MTILITGFTPFGSVQVNPSQLIVAYLQQNRADVRAVLLPTEYETAGELIRTMLHDDQPDGVIMLGVAQTRTNITLERIALNVDDAPIADNAGVLRFGQPIDPDGALAYTSSLPINAMLTALQTQGIPAAISNHAGTYVCNHVFYVAQRTLRKIGREMPCGFVHVPGLKPPEGDAPDGMTLAQMIEGIQICIDVITR